MSRGSRWITGGFLVLLANSSYLAATASPTLFYFGNVLGHVALGLALLVAALPLMTRVGRATRRTRDRWKVAALMLGIGAATGIYLVLAGNDSTMHTVLLVHVGATVIGAIAVAAALESRLVGAVLAVGTRRTAREASFRDRRSERHERGPRSSRHGRRGDGGREGALLPLPPPRRPMASSCPRPVLHGIRDLREVGLPRRHLRGVGVARRTTSRRSTTSGIASRSSTCRASPAFRPSKWCAGCHDHALLFTGMMDRPSKRSSTGPKPRRASAAPRATRSSRRTTRWATAASSSSTRRCTISRRATTRSLRALHDFVLQLDPEPHRRVVPEAAAPGRQLRVLLDAATRSTSTCRSTTIAGSAASTSTTTGRRAASRARARARSTTRPSP